VREEDLDWKVYHIVAARKSSGPDEVCSLVPCDPEEATASLDRLTERNLLVREGGGYRVASIHETLIACQLKHTRDCPIFFEDGVIKVKQPEREGE
jgi:hypothetical protein